MIEIDQRVGRFSTSGSFAINSNSGSTGGSLDAGAACLTSVEVKKLSVALVFAAAVLKAAVAAMHAANGAMKFFIVLLNSPFG